MEGVLNTPMQKWNKIVEIALSHKNSQESIWHQIFVKEIQY